MDWSRQPVLQVKPVRTLLYLSKSSMVWSRTKQSRFQNKTLNWWNTSSSITMCSIWPNLLRKWHNTTKIFMILNQSRDIMVRLWVILSKLTRCWLSASKMQMFGHRLIHIGRNLSPKWARTPRNFLLNCSTRTPTSISIQSLLQVSSKALKSMNNWDRAHFSTRSSINQSRKSVCLMASSMKTWSFSSEKSRVSLNKESWNLKKSWAMSFLLRVNSIKTISWTSS